MNPRDLDNHLARPIRPGDGEPEIVRGPLCTCGCGDPADEECGECGRRFARGCIERHWREEEEEMEAQVEVIPATYRRMSGMNDIAACPASYKESRGLPRTSNDASEMGTMRHEIISLLLRGVGIDERATAIRYGCDKAAVEKTLALLANYEKKPHWTLYVERDKERDTKVELSIGEVILTGHPDHYLISLDETEGELHDAKTGRMESPPIERNLQILSYAAGMFAKHPKLQRIEAYLDYTGLGYSDGPVVYEREWTMTTGLSILGEVLTRSIAANPEYRPGCSYCQYCEARHKCPALHKELPAYLTGAPALVPFAELPADGKARAIYTIKAAAKLVEDYEKQAKAWAREHGDIDLGDGKVFGVIEGTEREIDYDKGFEVLDSWLGEKFKGIPKVAIGAVLEAAKAQYEEDWKGDKERLAKGWKTKVESAVMADLKRAGALKEFPTAQVRVHNKKKDETKAA